MNENMIIEHPDGTFSISTNKNNISDRSGIYNITLDQLWIIKHEIESIILNADTEKK